VLQVALTVPRTEAEGPGVRFAVWVQGCPLRCPGCCNPEMLAFREAAAMTPAELLARILEVKGDIEGVSFLGGEPTSQAEGLAAVAAGARAHGLSVMVFSGFTLEELRARKDPHVDALLACTDLLVDGRYVESRRTLTRRYVGSDNQVMHFLTDRYTPADPRFSSSNTIEIRLVKGQVIVNGWPLKGALKIVESGG
jgi:anaerobic ribonucleoside-triphosphate reductase activating protein